MMDEINPNADEYLEQRARRGDRLAFERAMAKVPDVDVNEAPVNSIRKETTPTSDQNGEARTS